MKFFKEAKFEKHGEEVHEVKQAADEIRNEQIIMMLRRQADEAWAAAEAEHKA